jgi:hypothetical protein
MSNKTKMGIKSGLAPPDVSVAHYALNVVAATPQVLREATTHGCLKKPCGFIHGGVSQNRFPSTDQGNAYRN